MLTSYWELIKNEGRFLLDGYHSLIEQSAGITPPANRLNLYAKDKSSVSALYYRNDAGVDIDLSGGLTGSGTANRLAYWTSSTVLAANAALTQNRLLTADANGLPTSMSALTSTRIPVADSNGLLTDSANFTRDSNGVVTNKNTASGAALKLDSSNAAHNASLDLLINGTTLWKLSVEAATSKLQAFLNSANLSAMQWDTSRNTIVGTGAVATNASGPFFFLNSCAGTPTGTPSAITGQVPFVYDTTNNKLYGFNSSWRDLTGGSGSGALTGSGADTQIAYWTGTGALSSSANLIFDRTNVRLGLRVTPSFEFHGQSADGSSFNNTLDCYGTGVTANYRGRAARGTASAFSALQADDNILAISALPGINTNTFASGARANIIMKAAENLSTSNNGTYIIFSTTPTGGSTTLTERFRMGALGQLGIGGATFGTSGNLFQSGGASAAPSWLDHTSDFLSQYALLAGRSGGQNLRGGTASGNSLTLSSTSNATKGNIVFGTIAAFDEATPRFSFGQTTFAATQGSVIIAGAISNSNSGQSALILSNTFTGSAGGAGGEMYSCLMSPVFQPSGSIAFASGFRANVTFSPGSTVTITDCQGGRFIPITGSTAGAITNIAGVQALPSYGTLKPTNAYGLDVLDFGSSGITKAVGVRIIKPTGATNNYYLELDTADATDPTGGGGAATGRIPVLIGGTLRYLAYY